MNLGNSQLARFEHLDDLSDLENAISNQQKTVELTDDGHPNQPIYFSSLGISHLRRFERLGDLSDLENAISYHQKAIELTDDRHPDQPMYFLKLGISQKARFERLGDLSDLENAISNTRKAVILTDDGHPWKTIFLLGLGASLKNRFHHFGDSDDLTGCVLSYTTAAQLKSAYPSHALQAARQWVQISHRNGDLLCALDGYRTALELFSKVAWLGLDTRSREDTLLREKSENLGCLAATCAIRLGRLEEAVELLDLGRSVFWQQASSLRSDFETLREEDAELAERL
jgi:tetratricopeptide (TPR) repeat protein